MSQKLSYTQVHAFTGQGVSGNPAGVILPEEALSDDTMQTIAAQLDFPAHAFARQRQGAAQDWPEHWDVRWFAPDREITLCGHASLALGHVLLEESSGDRVNLHAQSGAVLTIRRLGQSLYELALPALQSKANSHDQAAALMGGTPLEIWRSEKGYNVFLYADEKQIRALSPDIAGLARLGSDQFIATARGDHSDIVSRVFTAGKEDSVTGSAHGVLAPFWTKRLGTDDFTAVQASERGGKLGIRMDGEQVWLSGQCVTIAQGEIAYSPSTG